MNPVRVELTGAQAAALLAELLAPDAQTDVERPDHARDVRDATERIAVALEGWAAAPAVAEPDKPRRGRPPGSRTRKRPVQAELPAAATRGALLGGGPEDAVKP